MPQTFTTKRWAVTGEQNFGEFTLLNPDIKVLACQVLDSNAVIVIEATENGGVFKHRSTVSYTEYTESDINEIVDAAMTAAFPDATVTTEPAE